MPSYPIKLRPTKDPSSFNENGSRRVKKRQQLRIELKSEHRPAGGLGEERSKKKFAKRIMISGRELPALASSHL